MTTGIWWWTKGRMHGAVRAPNPPEHAPATPPQSRPTRATPPAWPRALPPPPDAAPLLRCRCGRYRHSYSQLSSFAESVAVAGNAVSNAVHKLVPAKKDK